MAVLKAVYKSVSELTEEDTSIIVNIGGVVEPTKAFLMYSIRGPSDGAADSARGLVSGCLINPTQVKFERGGTDPGDVVKDFFISWTVVEFSSGVRVQRNTSPLSMSSATESVTLPTAVDTSKSWPLLSWFDSDATGNFDESTYLLAELTSSTNLNISVAVAAINTKVFWQVIEYDNCTVSLAGGSVQTLGASSTSASITIGSVNTAKTAVFGTIRITGTASNYLRRADWVWRLNSSTSISLLRAVGTEVDSLAALYIVEFSDDIPVQRGIEAQSGAAIFTDTLSPFVGDSSKALGYLTSQMLYSELLNDRGVDRTDETFATLVFNSNSQIEMQTSAYSTDYTAYWEVIDFSNLPGASTNTLFFGANF